jgi:hypothetical protein
VALGTWLGAGRSVPPVDADPGRPVGVKSSLRCGFAWWELSRIYARSGDRGSEDCGKVCSEDRDPEELGYPQFKRSIEPHL